MNSDSVNQLSFLRATLLATKPTGTDGFEGLVRACLQELTGVPMRLARSGSQFGRDSSSAPQLDFGVAMEAKRYDAAPSLEGVAGKALIGGYALEGNVDLWVLCTTAEVGDDVVQKSADILDQFGMTLLVLDWNGLTIPRLAILLATSPDETVNWFKTTSHPVDVVALRASLESIRCLEDFNRLADALRSEVAQPQVGIETLRKHAAEWFESRITSRSASKSAFGQYVTPCDPLVMRVDRKTARVNFEEQIALAMQENQSGRKHANPALVLLLGDEGNGKSWLVADWWASAPEKPILIYVSGRRSHIVARAELAHPLRAIAVLLAEQDGRDDQRRIEQWYRRLKRWSKMSTRANPRFVLVLDGLNEHTSMPWADILSAYASAMRGLGGVIVATSRPNFWRENVRPRVERDLTIFERTLEPYTDKELNELLAASGLSADTLTPLQKGFLRNPRVSSVAIQLMARSSLDVEDLTRERLLLEYWKARLEERGNLIGHSDRDLLLLLESHARSFLQKSKPFELDSWSQHSGLAKREGVERARADLIEIVEGRFMTPLSNRPDRYEFRPEVFPFAIGTLIAGEIRDATETNEGDSEEYLCSLVDRVIDPVRGFDELAEIVVASIGIGCLQPQFPENGLKALIRTWLGMQNLGVPSVYALASYIHEKPEIFLDLLEKADESTATYRDRDHLTRLLLVARSHPGVRNAISKRIAEWLSSWSREAVGVGDTEVRKRRQLAHEARCNAALNDLTRTQKALLTSLTTELTGIAAASRTRSAAILMCGLPLAPFARAIVGWSLSHTLATDIYDSESEIIWISLLNAEDAKHFGKAVETEVTKIGPDSAECPMLFRRATALALRLTGDPKNAAWANSIDPNSLLGLASQTQMNRLSEDPFDPKSTLPNREEILEKVARVIDEDDLWSSHTVSLEDREFDQALLVLARFFPADAQNAIRSILRSTRSREWRALRQLSTHLQQLAPLIDSECADEARRVTARLLSSEFGQHLVSDERERNFTIAEFASVSMLHASIDKQLEVLRSLPLEMPAFHVLARFLTRLPASTLAREMRQIPADRCAFLLLMIGMAGADVNEDARSQIRSLLRNADREVAAAAARLIGRLDDASLDNDLLAEVVDRTSIICQQREDHRIIYGVAAVILRRGANHSSLQNIPLDVLADLAESGDPVAVEVFDQQMCDLLQEFAVEDPIDAKSGSSVLITSSTKTFAERRSGILIFPPLSAIRGFVDRNFTFVRGWCSHFATHGSSLDMLRVSALASVLAAEIGGRDGALAAQVLHKLDSGSRSDRTVINGVSVLQRAAFTPVSELESLQEDMLVRCMSDSELESVIRAAEAAGAESHLDRLSTKWVQSSEPGLIARALTVAGLRRAVSHSRQLLAQSWGSGILNSIARSASRNLQRHEWTLHWYTLASNSMDELDVWRYGWLSARLADSRFYDLWLSGRERTDTFNRFADEIFDQMQAQSKRRTEKRKATLFGRRAPSDDIRRALRT